MWVGVERGGGMPRIGAHVSTSDGYPEAVERQVAAGGTCGQFHLGAPDRWEADRIPDSEARRFRAAMDENDIAPWVVRGSDPIDLATPDEEVGMRSLRTVQSELRVADALGVDYYVVSPGDHDGTTRKVGIANAVRRLSAVDHDGETTVLLENTAGRGTSLGAEVEELAEVVERSSPHTDAGLCLDTCSLYAAGYDLGRSGGLRGVLDAVESTVGIEHLRCLHLTDSRDPLGSHRDRPEHVGEGEIGEAGFERLVNHGWLRDLPMVVEPPDPGRITRDIATLRGLVVAAPERT